LELGLSFSTLVSLVTDSIRLLVVEEGMVEIQNLSSLNSAGKNIYLSPRILSERLLASIGSFGISHPSVSQSLQSREWKARLEPLESELIHMLVQSDTLQLWRLRF
jgi:hypothetical protein